MRKCVSMYQRGTLQIGCNGATVYIYDQNGKEITRFKDISYAYSACFMHSKNIMAVKSGSGQMAVYDLDLLKMIKGMYITDIGSQDDNCTFSPDDSLLYNISRPVSDLRTQIDIYETTGYTRVKTLFKDHDKLMLSHIEFDTETGICYVLGYMRGDDGVFTYGFLGILDEANEAVTDMKIIDWDRFFALRNYAHWMHCGFSERMRPDDTEVPDHRPTLKELYDSET